MTTLHPRIGRAYGAHPRSTRPRYGSGVSSARFRQNIAAPPYLNTSADIVKKSAKTPRCDPGSSGTRPEPSSPAVPFIPSGRRNTRTPALWALPGPVGTRLGAYIDGRPDAEDLVRRTATALRHTARTDPDGEGRCAHNQPRLRQVMA